MRLRTDRLRSAAELFARIRLVHRRTQSNANGVYPEYHTSADNLPCVNATALGDSWRIVMQGVDILQQNRRFLNQSPKGEPQLGPRGLYEAAESYRLFCSDGRHSLLDFADRTRMPSGDCGKGRVDCSGAGCCKT